MITKAIEIRDKGTFIPAIAIKMTPAFVPAAQLEANSRQRQAYDHERYLLRRSGYVFDEPCCVMLVRMDANGSPRQASYDPHGWGAGNRTYIVAHTYIVQNFEALENGQVVDVEFILGETQQAKESESAGGAL